MGTEVGLGQIGRVRWSPKKHTSHGFFGGQSRQEKGILAGDAAQNGDGAVVSANLLLSVCTVIL